MTAPLSRPARFKKFFRLSMQVFFIEYKKVMGLMSEAEVHSKTGCDIS